MTTPQNEYVRFLCKECGSSNITVDATADWNFKTQSWDLVATHDAAYCNECDGPTKLKEITMKGKSQ